jgi:deazaflavin-dependent oxidoreductase (nitroreductase family)
MWFMNKVINPLVRLILRSPLHKLMSNTLLVITYCGRKTGREYSLPVQYVQAGNIIYIVPGMPEKKTWWRNLKEAAPVRLNVRGQSLTGTGVVLKPETDSEAILEGFGIYLRRFPALTKGYHIGVEADGNFNVKDLQQAARQTVIIRVEVR